MAGAGHAQLLSSMARPGIFPKAVTAAVVLADVRVLALDGATQSVQLPVTRYLPLAHVKPVTVQVLRV